MLVMVARRRTSRILASLALWTASGLAVSYFAFHAEHGGRGLEARREVKARILALAAEIAETKAERAVWEQRVDLMRSSGVDRDLLDERTRVLLGRVHRNDAVLMAPRT